MDWERERIEVRECEREMNVGEKGTWKRKKRRNKRQSGSDRVRARKKESERDRE